MKRTTWLGLIEMLALVTVSMVVMTFLRDGVGVVHVLYDLAFGATAFALGLWWRRVELDWRSVLAPYIGRTRQRDLPPARNWQLQLSRVSDRMRWARAACWVGAALTLWWAWPSVAWANSLILHGGVAWGMAGERIAMLPIQLGLVGAWVYLGSLLGADHDAAFAEAMRPEAIATTQRVLGAAAEVVEDRVEVDFPLPAAKLPAPGPGWEARLDWLDRVRYFDAVTEQLLWPWREAGASCANGRLQLSLSIVDRRLPQTLTRLKDTVARLADHWRDRAALPPTDIVVAAAWPLSETERRRLLGKAIQDPRVHDQVLARRWARQLHDETRYEAWAMLHDEERREVCRLVASSPEESPMARIRFGLLADDDDREAWWHVDVDDDLFAGVVARGGDEPTALAIATAMAGGWRPRWAAQAVAILAQGDVVWTPAGRTATRALLDHLATHGRGTDLAYLQPYTHLDGDIGRQLDLTIAYILTRAGDRGGLTLADDGCSGRISEAEAGRGQISAVAAATTRAG